MSVQDPRTAELEARLRRMYSGLDAGPGFETRVRERIASEPARQRQQEAERRHARELRRLRRRAWIDGLGVAAAGVTATALLWRLAEPVAELAAGLPPNVLIGGTVAAVAAVAWFASGRPTVWRLA